MGLKGDGLGGPNVAKSGLWKIKIEKISQESIMEMQV